MPTKKRSNTKSKYDNFDNFLNSNPHPHVTSIPTDFNRSQKTFSIHDMKSITPMTRNQQRVFDLWKDDYSIVLDGFSGVGKSFLSIYLALKDILDADSVYEKIIIVRSTTSIRSPGFLPGSLEEKNSVFEMPYSQIFDDLFKKKNQYKFMKEAGLVEFHSTAFLRGLSFTNAIVIFDEFQNANYEEIATCIQRIARQSKLILCGDYMQNDLIRMKNDVSGFKKAIDIINMMPDFRKVSFEIADCVRSEFVKSFLVAESIYNERN